MKLAGEKAEGGERTGKKAELDGRKEAQMHFVLTQFCSSPVSFNEHIQFQASCNFVHPYLGVSPTDHSVTDVLLWIDTSENITQCIFLAFFVLGMEAISLS